MPTPKKTQTLGQRVQCLEAIQRVQAGNLDSTDEECRTLGQQVDALKSDIKVAVAQVAKVGRSYDDNLCERMNTVGKVAYGVADDFKKEVARLDGRFDGVSARLGAIEDALGAGAIQSVEDRGYAYALARRLTDLEGDERGSWQGADGKYWRELTAEHDRRLEDKPSWSTINVMVARIDALERPWWERLLRWFV